MAEWQTAVSSGNAVMLSELVCASAPSPDQALALVRGCVEVLEKKVASAAPATSSVETRMPSVVAKPATPASLASTAAPVTPALNGYAETAVANNDQPLCTLEGVQLLQPRGRFNLEFRKLGILITGKAGSVNAAWDNVRHIIRLPRPEGFNWGKLLDPNDPAGSDLLALPLKEPVPFRKTHASIVVVQPDPKVKHAEVSITLDGVSHKVSGSQGTIMSEVLKLLSRVRECKPDRGLFFTRESKSFVKCYHGVNEGSLFPLKQGLLFMKPALFLPRGNISEVVCGRGGSATTRYVDLVVGVEASAAGGEAGGEQRTEEFSNIEREALPGLQQYIQNALVAPREREARKASAATAKKPLPASSSPSSLAAPAQSTAPASTVAAEADQSQVTAAPLSAASTTATATATSTQAVAPRKSTRTVPSSQNGGGSSTLAGAGDGKTAMVVNGGASPVSKKEGEEEEEEDDGDAESDEDYGPPGSDESDGDYSGSDVSSAHDGDDSGSDDDDSDDNSDAGEEGLEGDEVDGAGGSDGKVDKNKKREDEGQGDEVDDAGGSNGDEDKVDRKRKRSSGGDGGKVNRDSKVAAEKAGGRDGGEPERGTEEKGFANIGGGGGKGGNEDEDTESDGEERRRKK